MDAAVGLVVADTGCTFEVAAAAAVVVVVAVAAAVVVLAVVVVFEFVCDLFLVTW